MTTIEEIRQIKAEVEPHLFAEGWVREDEGPTIPNPFNSDEPIQLRYRHPDTALYYSFRDAWNIVTGRESIRAGIASIEERGR